MTRIIFGLLFAWCFFLIGMQVNEFNRTPLNSDPYVNDIIIKAQDAQIGRMSHDAQVLRDLNERYRDLLLTECFKVKGRYAHLSTDENVLLDGAFLKCE
jgi:hypothetical protein